MALLNTAFAESAGELADKINAGGSPRDVVAETFKTHDAVIFNGNGYSDEWPIEAEKRGLANLKNTVDAWETFTSAKNVKLFSEQKVFTEKEVHARQEIAFEKYINDLMIESNCLLDMMQTGVIPACAADLATFSGSSLGSSRGAKYAALEASVDSLQSLVDAFPDDADVNAQARYCVDVIKPQMLAVREASDTAERLVEASKWPYPKYSEILFQHHFEEGL